MVQPRRLQAGDQRPRQAAVQPFDGLQLTRQVSVVGAFVGSFQVEADEVVLLELGPGRFQLALEVGVSSAGAGSS